MAEHTVFTCDRCQQDFADCVAHVPRQPFPAQWSCTQKLGVTVFILCETCTEALHAFLGMSPPNAALIAKEGDEPTSEEPTS